MHKTLITFLASVALTLGTAIAAQNPPISMTFRTAADCKIMLAADRAGSLADLKAGDRIRITYHNDGAAAVADRIRLILEPQGAGKDGDARGPGRKPDARPSLHGMVTAVDRKAGLVTVVVHQKGPGSK